MHLKSGKSVFQRKMNHGLIWQFNVVFRDVFIVS